MMDRKLVWDVPKTHTDALRDAETCHIISVMVRAVADRERRSWPIVVRDNLGDSLTVPFEAVGLIDHDQDLESLAWPESVTSEPLSEWERDEWRGDS